MPIRNSFPAKLFYQVLEKSFLSKLTHHSIKPDHFTLLGLILAIMVPFGFYAHPILGFLFILSSGVADAVDGLMARNHGMDSNFGAFLDSSLDRFSDFFYIFGFWVLFWGSDRMILASTLIFLSLLFASMISYVKAKAEGLGYKCEVGLMERGLRTLFLIVWALLLSLFPSVLEIILWSGLILYSATTLFTVIQRIIYIKSQLVSQPGQAGTK